MEQLETAVAAFQPDFDLASFSAAWHSKSAKERNRAMLVRSNMDDLHNGCQALIDRSVRLAQDFGAIPADRKTPASAQLRKQGLYNKEVEGVMQQVAHLRNVSQHEYWTLGPVEVHAAVMDLRRQLPAFIASLGDWIDALALKRSS